MSDKRFYCSTLEASHRQIGGVRGASAGVTVNRLRKIRLAMAVAAIASPVAVRSTFAADAAWNVNADGNWATAGSWTPAAAPGSTASTTSPDTATFGTIASATRTVTVDANRNILNISFAGNSSGYILSSGSLLLSSGGTLQTSGGGSTHTDSVTAPITLEGSYTFATNSTTAGRILNIGTTVTSAETTGTTTLTLDGIGTSASNAISGIISNGTGSNQVAISKNGVGLWVLSGANTFTGDVAINSGTLRGVNTANTNVLAAFGTGNTINLNAGTLQLQANGTTNGGSTIVASNNVTTGATAVTINVDRFSGSNTQNAISFTNLSLGSGQLNLTGGNQYNLRFSGTTALTGNATINSTTSGLSLVGIVSGSGFGITKLGAASAYASTQVGNLTLSGANTYTGTTSVLEGQLIVNADAPSGAAGALGNATSDVLLGNTSGSVNAYLLANNFTVGRNVVVQSGNSGTAFLGSSSTSNAGQSTYSGNVTLGTTSGTGHSLTLVTGAFHVVTFSGVMQDPTGLSGAGGVVTIGSTSTANFLTGTFSPNPTNSSSIIILSGANTYTGGTVINTLGGVRFSNNSAFGTGSLSIVAGSIQQGSPATALAGVSGMTWDGNFGITNFTFGGQIPVNLGVVPVSLTGNRIVTVNSGTTTVGGIISGSGKVLQFNAGSASGVTLNGANTFDGGLIVAGSTGANSITVSSGNASALGGSGSANTGAVTLTNTTNSIVTLGVNTTVGYLTSGINNSATIASGGTSTLAAGTYALTISGGGGTGATGTATISALNGPVTAVSITGVGANYTSSPTITLANSTATFTPATFGASSINLNPGTARTLTIAGTNSTAATFQGVISGTGGKVFKDGSGTQVLAGTNTYTGGTSVSAGRLAVSGTLGTGSVTVSGGVLELDSNTSIGNSGALVLTGGATLDLEFTTGTFEIVGPLTFGGVTYISGNYAVGDALTTGYFTGVSGAGVTATPEPASLGLLGLGGMAMLRRRRRQA